MIFSPLFEGDPATTIGNTLENPILDTRSAMEEVFLRDSQDGKPLCVLLFSADDGESVADLYGLAVKDLMEALEGQLRASDPELLVYRTKSRLMALKRGVEPEAAIVLATQRIQAARKVDVPGRSRPVRLSVSAGVAENREDIELYFQTLIDVAQEGLSVARGRGGECCVHTMLYGLLQSIAERNATEGSAPRKSARRGGAGVKRVVVSGVVSPSAPDTDAATPREDAHVREATDPTSQDVEAEARKLAADMARQHVEAIRRDFEQRLEQARGQLADGESGDVDMLRRRVQKLTDSLERAEARLVELSRMKDVDAGLASIYREIQGLSSDTDNYEAKRDMMKNIFEANLALQQRLVG